MGKDDNILTKEQKSEVKRLRKDVANELKLLKKVSVPELQIAHLERIIRFYNRIHDIEKPTISDRAVLNMIKIQYKGMCALRRIRPQRDIL